MNEKKKLLIREKYLYDGLRGIWINNKTKKIFTDEAIEDFNVNWLKKKIDESNTEEGFQFYGFNEDEIGNLRNTLNIK